MSSDRSPTLRRRAVLATAATALGTTLAGCAGLRTRVRELRLGEPERQVPADWQPDPGQWPMNGYDYAWTHHNPFATPPRSAPESAWTYDEYNGELNALVTVDGTVYIRTDRELVAIDASDGSERWRQPRETGGGLKYVAGRLYDTGADELRALAPDGAET